MTSGELRPCCGSCRWSHCSAPLPSLRLDGIGWCIIGGESGAGAREMQLAWVRDIIARCDAARVPVFVKQLGSALGRELGAGSKAATSKPSPKTCAAASSPSLLRRCRHDRGPSGDHAPRIRADTGACRGCELRRWHWEAPGEKRYPQRISSDGNVALIAETYIDPAHRPYEAEHIASWSPPVALAVAECLRLEAVAYDELERTSYGAEGAAFVAGDFGGDVDPALRLARLYLGEEAP